MKITAKTGAGLAIAVAIVSFVAGALWNHAPQAIQASTGDRRILYYHDPMHPAYRSDKPGIAPDCGMALEPVYADDPTGGAEAPSMPPGAVRISAEQQQLIDCSQRIRSLGYEILPEPPALADAGIYRLRIQQHADISLKTIYPMTEQLIAAALPYRTVYSHWEVDGNFRYTHIAKSVKLQIAAEIQIGVRETMSLQQFGISHGEKITGDRAKALLLDDLP